MSGYNWTLLELKRDTEITGTDGTDRVIIEPYWNWNDVKANKHEEKSKL